MITSLNKPNGQGKIFLLVIHESFIKILHLNLLQFKYLTIINFTYH